MANTNLDILIAKWNEFDSRSTEEQIEAITSSEELRNIVDGITKQAKALESLLIASGCDSEIID